MRHVAGKSGFPNSPVEVDGFCVSLHQTLLRPFNAFHLTQKVRILSKTNLSCLSFSALISYFKYGYFISSWNEIGILHSKWIQRSVIPMFVTALSVAVVNSEIVLCFLKALHVTAT
jgi:hypothetical protein